MLQMAELNTWSFSQYFLPCLQQMEHGVEIFLYFFFSASLNRALFWCFERTASHSSLAQDKEKAGEIRGKFLRERLPASQPTSKRLPFDSLFVLLTDRIALSFTIHERCCPLTYLKSAQGILFSETCYTFFGQSLPVYYREFFPESWDRGVL